MAKSTCQPRADLCCGPAASEPFLARDLDGISFMDDWGSMRGLLISPHTWREFFKPLYADYCRAIHQADKFAFFHSDGHIAAIIADLIDCGVDALNSQLFCMDIEELARRYGGHITFWGEIDRQRILPFGTGDEVRQAVRRVRRAFDTGEGGLIAQFEWGNDVPAEAVRIAFEAWEEPLPAVLRGGSDLASAGSEAWSPAC